MALIAAAFDAWPSGHRFKPSDPAHLRRWLQVRAGHYDVSAEIDTAGMTPMQAVVATVAAMRQAGEHSMLLPRGEALVVIKPRTIRFSALGHEMAQAIYTEVETIIRDEINLSFDDEHLAAHAPERGGWRDAMTARSAHVAEA